MATTSTLAEVKSKSTTCQSKNDKTGEKTNVTDKVDIFNWIRTTVTEFINRDRLRSKEVTTVQKAPSHYTDNQNKLDSARNDTRVKNSISFKEQRISQSSKDSTRTNGSRFKECGYCCFCDQVRYKFSRCLLVNHLRASYLQKEIRVNRRSTPKFVYSCGSHRDVTRRKGEIIKTKLILERTFKTSKHSFGSLEYSGKARHLGTRFVHVHQYNRKRNLQKALSCIQCSKRLNSIEYLKSLEHKKQRVTKNGKCCRPYRVIICVPETAPRHKACNNLDYGDSDKLLNCEKNKNKSHLSVSHITDEQTGQSQLISSKSSIKKGIFTSHTFSTPCVLTNCSLGSRVSLALKEEIANSNESLKVASTCLGKTHFDEKIPILSSPDTNEYSFKDNSIQTSPPVVIGQTYTKLPHLTLSADKEHSILDRAVLIKKALDNLSSTENDKLSDISSCSSVFYENTNEIGVSDVIREHSSDKKYHIGVIDSNINLSVNPTEEQYRQHSIGPVSSATYDFGDEHERSVTLTSCNKRWSECFGVRSLYTAKERRRLFAERRHNSMDISNVLHDSDNVSASRNDVRRLSAMHLLGKQSKGRRDSVVTFPSRKLSDVRKLSSDSESGGGRNSGPPSRRVSCIGVPQFIKQRNSFDSMHKRENVQSSNTNTRRTSIAVPYLLKHRSSVRNQDLPEISLQGPDERLQIYKSLEGNSEHNRRDISLCCKVPVIDVVQSGSRKTIIFLEDVMQQLETCIHQDYQNEENNNEDRNIVVLKSSSNPEILDLKELFHKSTEQRASREEYKTSPGSQGRTISERSSLAKQESITKVELDGRNSIATPSFTEKQGNTPDDLRPFKDIIASMTAELNTVESQIKGCNEMRHYVHDESLEVLLSKEAGIECVIAALKKFKKDIELVTEALKTLSSMSATSDASCVHICKENGVPVLLQIQQIYREKPSISLLVLDIIASISLTEELAEVLMKHNCHSEVLATMSRHSDDNTVANQSCFIIGNLVCTVEVAQTIMYVCGVHAIIGAMNRFPHDIRVLENGCRALGCFASYDEVCMDVANAGAVFVVLKAMRTMEDVCSLQECACWALACLTKFEEPCVILCQNNGIETLLRILNMYPTAETIHEYGSWTLSNVATQDRLITNIDTEGVLRMLINALGIFAQKSEVEEQIFFVLSQVVMASDDRKHQMLKLDGTKKVLDVMTSFPDFQTLQEHGCRIIGNLAVNDECRESIESDEASKGVISAMLTHDRNEEIQMYGCMALTNITADSNENKASVVKNSGVKTILSSLNELQSDGNIVLCGLKTLANIMELEDACYDFVEEEGVQLMKEIRNAYPESADINLFICIVLSNIAGVTVLQTSSLVEVENLLHQVLTCFKQQKDDINLCICHFYENLVLTDGGCEVFEDLHWMRKLDDIMTALHYSPDVQISGCKTIVALCMHNLETFNCDTDCLRLIFHALQTHHDNWDLQTICCGAIACLSEHNEKICSEVKNKGGVNKLITVLTSLSEERLQTVGLIALDSLLKHDAEECNVQQLDAIVHTVAKSMLKWPDNAEIQIYACRVLSSVGKEGIQDDTLTKSNVLDYVIYALKRRHASKELKSSAILALQTLLYGRDEDLVSECRKRLPFLPEDVWIGTYTAALVIE